MKVFIDRLTDFSSNHSEEAELAIQQWVCNEYNLNAGSVSQGYYPYSDFDINNVSVELKVSKYGTTNSAIELCRDDGTPSGLSITEARIHMFLNQAGPEMGKLRIIRTGELRSHYYSNQYTLKKYKGYGDKKGTTYAPLNFKRFNDLMIGVCTYNRDERSFDLNTLVGDNYARQYINRYF